MKIVDSTKTWAAALLFSFLIIVAVLITRSFSVSAAESTGTYTSGAWNKIAAAAADALNNNLASVGGQDKVDVTAFMSSPDAVGGLLGFTASGMDINSESGSQTINELHSDGVVPVLMGVDVSTAVVYPYKSIADTDKLKDAADKYISYGRMLQALGLDVAAENGFSDSTRQLIGIIVLGIYILGNFVNAFFDFVLGILNYANLFYLFKQAAYMNQNTLGTAAGAGVAGGSYIDQAITAIGNTLGDFYDVLYDNAMSLFIPICLVCAVFIWLIRDKGSFQNGVKVFKNLAIRAIFTAVGIALLCSVYTTALSIIGDMNINTSETMRMSVGATFFDFEKLVYEDGLKMNNVTGAPSELSYGTVTSASFESKTGVPVSTCAAQVRPAALAVNGDSTNAAKAALGDHGVGDFDVVVLDKVGTPGSDKKAYTAISNDAIIDLIERFAAGDKVKAASYESFVRGAMKLDSEAAQTKMAILNYLSDNWERYSEDTYVGRNVPVPTGSTVIEKIDFVDSSTRLSDWYIWSSAAAATDAKKIDGKNKIPSDGLAPLAIYNYLSTKFDTSQMTVYGTNSTGTLSKAEHYSVNLVGDSIMKYIYLADLIVLLASVSVVGYFYGFGLLVSNFKAMMKFIPAALAGTLGVIRGVAMAVIIVAALIIEILGTALIYNIGTLIVISAYKLIEFPIAEIMTSLKGAGGGGGLFAIVTGALSAFIMLFMMLQLIKYRYAICHAVTDMATEAINKFLGTNVSGDSVDVSMNPKSTLPYIGAGAAMVAGTAISGGLDTDQLGGENGEVIKSMGNVARGENGSSGLTGDASDSRGDGKENDEVPDTWDPNKDGDGSSGKSGDQDDAVSSDFEDGDEMKSDDENGRTFEKSDGTKVTENPDGSKHIERPDGSTVDVDADGTATITDADGNEIATFDKDGKSMVASGDNDINSLEDGQSMTTDDGRKISKKDGDIIIEDDEGNVTTIMSDGKVTFAKRANENQLPEDQTNANVGKANDTLNASNSPYVGTDGNGTDYEVSGTNDKGEVLVTDKNGKTYTLVDGNGKAVTADTFDASQMDSYGAIDVDTQRRIEFADMQANPNYVPPSVDADVALRGSDGKQYYAKQNDDGTWSATDATGTKSFDLVNTRTGEKVTSDNIDANTTAMLAANGSYSGIASVSANGAKADYIIEAGGAKYQVHAKDGNFVVSDMGGNEVGLLNNSNTGMPATEIDAAGSYTIGTTQGAVAVTAVGDTSVNTIGAHSSYDLSSASTPVAALTRLENEATAFGGGNVSGGGGAFSGGGNVSGGGGAFGGGNVSGGGVIIVATVNNSTCTAYEAGTNNYYTSDSAAKGTLMEFHDSEGKIVSTGGESLANISPQLIKVQNDGKVVLDHFENISMTAVSTGFGSMGSGAGYDAGYNYGGNGNGNTVYIGSPTGNGGGNTIAYTLNGNKGVTYVAEVPPVNTALATSIISNNNTKVVETLTAVATDSKAATSPTNIATLVKYNVINSDMAKSPELVQAAAINYMNYYSETIDTTEGSAAPSATGKGGSTKSSGGDGTDFGAGFSEKIGDLIGTFKSGVVIAANNARGALNAKSDKGSAPTTSLKGSTPPANPYGDASGYVK